MKILGTDRVLKFGNKHARASEALDVWLEVVERSDWKTPQQIKERFPSADFLPHNRVIFNIKGNHYRLVASVGYHLGRIVVEWVGTHAEYDKLTLC